MKKLELFIKNLCGEFNNDEQISKEKSHGKIIHPKAKHINGVLNDRIKNIPENFDGYFVLEESYYDTGTFKNILPHLFLFNLDKDHNIVLTSYEIPEDITKEEFRNDNLDLNIDFNNLKVSNKFNPITYYCVDGIFKGESVSHLNAETTFTLKETIKDGVSIVSEVFEKNGKITFGCTDPIVYKKKKP